MKNCNFKIKFSRTNKKSECINCVKGPKMWNDLPADIKLCKSMFTFVTHLDETSPMSAEFVFRYGPKCMGGLILPILVLLHL